MSADLDELRAQFARVLAQRDAALAGLAAALTFHSLPPLVSLDDIARWRDMTGCAEMTPEALVKFLRSKKTEATR